MSSKANKKKSGTSTPPPSALVVTALCCHVKTTKRQERRIARMFPPHDDEMKGWKEFVKELAALGANDVDHEFYGGLNFLAPDEATGHIIANKALELLNKPIKHATKPIQ